MYFLYTKNTDAKERKHGKQERKTQKSYFPTQRTTRTLVQTFLVCKSNESMKTVITSYIIFSILYTGHTIDPPAPLFFSTPMYFSDGLTVVERRCSSRYSEKMTFHTYAPPMLFICLVNWWVHTVCSSTCCQNKQTLTAFHLKFVRFLERVTGNR